MNWMNHNRFNMNPSNGWNLIQIENYTKFLLNSLGGVFVILDISGRIKHVNNIGCEILEYSLDELIGKDWFKTVIPPIERDIRRKKHENLINNLNFDGIEVLDSLNKYSLLTKSGSEKIIEGVIFCLKSHNESDIFIYGNEITKYGQIDSIIQENVGKYQDLLERANDGIVVVQDSLLKYVNPRITEITGYSVEEMTNTPYSNYIHPNEIDTIENRYEKRMKGEYVIPVYDTKLVRKDGSIIDVEFNAGIINYQDRPADLVFVRNITNHKKAEEALEKTKENYRMLVEKLEEGLMLEDAEGIITFVNPKTLETLGYLEHELLGKHYNYVIPPEEMDKVNIESNKRREGISSTYESSLLAKNGKRIPVLVSAAPIFSDTGKYEGSLALSTDISIHKQVEKEREELMKKREIFIAMTSHELRTPLTVLRGQAEFLEKQYNRINPIERENSFKSIYKNLDRLTRLVDEVGEMIHIQRETFRVDLKEIDIADLLNQVICSYYNILGDQIKYVGTFDLKESLFIMGDNEKLQNVLENIIKNAVDNTPPSYRQIDISFNADNESLSIIISDNGAGIASENLELIFHEFVTIPTEYCVKGTGLGLFISRKIIEKHGGTLKAHSEGIGHGATFIIQLPRKV